MKITFVTFHNWETKRIGGFHKFADACAKAGNEVLFFSFARPYFIKYKNEERLNAKVFETLTKGKLYEIGGNATVNNFTWPTLRIPMPLHKYVPSFINRWLETHSLTPFSKICAKYLDGTDIFVFESCEGIALFDKIKKHYPSAKYIYRPSDPLAVSSNANILQSEYNILTKSDLVFIVNQEGLDLYRIKFPDFDSKVNYKLLSNGVDTHEFTKSYPVPVPLQKDNTALYLGARKAQWDLLLYSAEKCPKVNFVIVCPENPPLYFLQTKLSNIQYIPGVKPSDVPAWVTNCKIIIIPNPIGLWKIKPWGITAKYYQAMKAGKPIVSYEDTPRLKAEFNIDVAYNKEDFVSYIMSAINEKEPRLYKLENKDWNSITQFFLDEIVNL